MTFKDVVLACFDDREFVGAFDRLTGCNMLGRGTPLDRMVDDATGRFEHDALVFIGFVFDVVWLRCPALHDTVGGES